MTTQTLITVLVIIFIHWFADFVCQTDWQAKNKSKDWDALLLHTTAYSCIWLFGMIIVQLVSDKINGDVLLPDTIWWFPFITFACHTATDYYTSRVNTKLWEDKDVHGFFVSVGFDQVLHYGQLFFTYYILTK